MSSGVPKTKYPTKKVYAPCKQPEGDGLTSAQFDKLCALITEALPFPVRLSVNEQKYVFGTVNITPLKEDRVNGDRYRWTGAQAQEAIQFMLLHGLTLSMADQLKSPHAPYIFASGIWYIVLDRNAPTLTGWALDALDTEDERVREEVTA